MVDDSMKNDIIVADDDSLIDSLPLDRQTASIAREIMNENDIDKVKDLTNLFNLNQRKKNVLRIMKFNGLLDTISDEMWERFESRAGEFSNMDLLNYMQTVQSAIDRAQKSLDLVSDTPAIQLNTQNNVNINVSDTLDRESKERVADAIRAILQKAQSMKDDVVTYMDDTNDSEEDEELHDDV